MEQGKIFERLIHLSREKGLQVKFAPLQYNYGRLKGDRIGLANDLSIEQMNYTLAHELAHAYLHFDKGDILQNDGSYEEQADRSAIMLLDMVRLIVREEGTENAAG